MTQEIGFLGQKSLRKTRDFFRKVWEAHYPAMPKNGWIKPAVRRQLFQNANKERIKNVSETIQKYLLSPPFICKLNSEKRGKGKNSCHSSHDERTVNGQYSNLCVFFFKNLHTDPFCPIRADFSSLSNTIQIHSIFQGIPD